MEDREDAWTKAERENFVRHQGGFNSKDEREKDNRNKIIWFKPMKSRYNISEISGRNIRYFLGYEVFLKALPYLA